MAKVAKTPKKSYSRNIFIVLGNNPVRRVTPVSAFKSLDNRCYQHLLWTQLSEGLRQPGWMDEVRNIITSLLKKFMVEDKSNIITIKVFFSVLIRKII